VAGPGSLIFGTMLMSDRFRIWFPKWHRYLGRIQAGLVLLLVAPSGLWMAWYAAAGPVATAGFGLLAMLWIAVNLLGWRVALQRRFDAHRRWMLRSWALTLAAVTLRLYMLAFPSLDAYRAISFLCWIPNLLIVEAWLRLATRNVEPR
jgi:hypothetical protein